MKPPVDRKDSAKVLDCVKILAFLSLSVLKNIGNIMVQ